MQESVEAGSIRTINQLDPRNSLRVNLSNSERIVSFILGSVVLGTFFLRKRPIALGAQKRFSLGPGFVLGGELVRRALTGHSFLYQVLDITTRRPRYLSHGEQIKREGGIESYADRVITVNRPAEALYSYLLNFENYPKFMNKEIEMRSLGENRAQWIVRGPQDSVLECETQITESRPNELISWKTEDSARGFYANERVELSPAPGDRGTEVRIRLDYSVASEETNQLLNRIFGRDLDQHLLKSLRLFKKFMETGEIIQVQGQSSGRLAA